MRLAASLLILLLATGTSQAQLAEVSCQVSDVGEYPPAGAPPRILVSQPNDLDQWHPPTCAGWSRTSRPKLVVTLAGSFRFDGTMNELVARLGEISQLKTIPYWSAKDRKWMPLARDASALNSPHPTDRRGDFSPAELKPGADLYYWEDDPLTGETVYELKVYQRTSDHLVIGSENVTRVRKFIFTLFKPGASRSALFLQRIAPGTYAAYMVASALQGASSLVHGHEDDYVNRARAIFAFLSAKKPSEAKVALSSDGSAGPDRGDELQ